VNPEKPLVGGLGLWLVLLLAGCSPAPEAPVRYLIGVSQANLSEPWRISMTDEIQRQAALHPEMRLIVADASDSLGKQIGDLEKFEALGVDLLIVSPLESEAITPTVTRIFQSIPVIVLNRSVANYDYTLFIGPDNARIGQEAGRFVAKILADSGGEVLEVLGRSGSPPTLERAQAFRHAIAGRPLIRLQSPVLANWLRDGAEDLVLERLKTDGPPQVIFAHNDAMAYGAWLAAEKLGLSRRITFLGVDGLPGPRGGLELLRSGILGGTFLSPTGGTEAIEYALAILNHQGEQPKKVILGTRFLTRSDLSFPTVHSTVSGAPPRTVGFLASSGTDGWRKLLKESVERALSSGGWTLVRLTGPELPSHLDAVIVDSSDGSSADTRLRASVEAVVRSRGLPLFRLGPQPPPGDDSGWILALGPDPVEEGRRGGRWLATTGARRVLEITGPRDSAGTSDRSMGLRQGTAERATALVTATINTNGTRAAAREVVLAALDEGLPFDSVFAHSDEASLGAIDALTARSSLGTKVRVAGVGGGVEAMEALKRTNLACLVRSPSDLGPLLRNDLARALSEPGVSRRLVTSHDVLTR